MSFFIFLEMAFKADLIKGFLVLIKALLILFCLISSCIESGMLVFGLIVFSGSWLCISKIVSERIEAALFIILIGSAFSEAIRLSI